MEHKATSSTLGTVFVSGIITTDGAGATTSSGDGWSAARTSTGLYRITLAKKYVSLLSCKASMGGTASSAYKPQYKTSDVTAATPYVDIIVDGASDESGSALSQYSSAYQHKAGTTPTLVTAANGSGDLAVLKTLTLDIATRMVAHDDDTNIHPNADTGALAIAAWASSPNVPADLTECQNILTEVKGDWNTHVAKISSSGVLYHNGPDARNLVSAANATNQATSDTLANELKAAFNRNVQNKPSSAAGLVDPLSSTIHFTLALTDTNA